MRRIEFPSEQREFRQLTAAALMERNVITCRPSYPAAILCAFLMKLVVLEIWCVASVWNQFVEPMLPPPIAM